MRNILVLLAGLISTILSGQQLSTYSIYREQLILLNPAAISSDYMIEGHSNTLGLSHRQQWIGVEDAPVNSVARFEWQNDEDNDIGTGLWLIKDGTGKIGYQGIAANFHYSFPLTFSRRHRTKNYVSIGVSGGMFNFFFRASEIELRDPEDELSQYNYNAIHPDFSLGIFFFNKKKYYAGISIPQFFETYPHFNITGKSVLQRKRHYFAYGGLFFNLGQEYFWEPTLFVRYVEHAPLSIDANIRLIWNEIWWTGIGVGTSAGHAECGFYLKKSRKSDDRWKIGLAYDFYYRKLFGHTLEVNACYSWNRSR